MVQLNILVTLLILLGKVKISHYCRGLWSRCHHEKASGYGQSYMKRISHQDSLVTLMNVMYRGWSFSPHFSCSENHIYCSTEWSKSVFCFWKDPLGGLSRLFMKWLRSFPAVESRSVLFLLIEMVIITESLKYCGTVLNKITSIFVDVCWNSI